MKRLLLPLILLSLAVCVHADYSRAQLESDFQNGAAIGVAVHDLSVRLSKDLSRSIAPEGKVSTSFTVSQMRKIQDRLRATLNRPLPADVTRQIPEAKPPKLDERMDVPTRGVGAAGLAAAIEPGVAAGQSGDGLLILSQRFEQICAGMANGIVAVPDGSLAAAFADLLTKPENLPTRWVFTGVADAVALDEGLQSRPGATAVRNLLPSLHAESRAKAAKINWDFGALAAEKPNAAAALRKSFQSTISRFSTARQAATSAAAGQPVSRAQAKGMWGNIWDDITAGAADDFETGTQIGSTAGQFIGAVAGGIAGNTAFGPAGIAPGATEGAEAGELLGWGFGGIVGVIGGAVGTTAGYIYGAFESRTSRHSAAIKAAPKRGGSTGPVAAEPAPAAPVKVW